MSLVATSPIEFHGETKRFPRIAAVLEGSDPDNPTHAGAKVVTAVMIAEAKRRSHETCHCEEHGLRPGLTLAQLRPLEAGCRSPLYVCSTLGKVRRMLEA